MGKDILEVGSYIDGPGGGSYRELCEQLGFKYTGCDIRLGKNVDVVIPEVGSWRFPNQYDFKFDVIISGQCLEHVRTPWIWMDNLSRSLRSGGLAIIIAPNTWRYHEQPIDCWRIWPEGMRALFTWASLETLETAYIGPDTFGVAKKP